MVASVVSLKHLLIVIVSDLIVVTQLAGRLLEGVFLFALSFWGRCVAHRISVEQGLLVCSVFSAAATAAKSLQSCPTLGDPIDGSPSGAAVPGILQARTLEWVAISFSMQADSLPS